ncbi:MAG: ABC transporter substrate-binding protein [Bryobacterales bacterium]|nr:ABC transporter substrate-binding protein [Bryobacterales bacterium]
MIRSWLAQAGRAPLALLASALLMLALIGWLAPTAGVAKANRIDNDGPPPFEGGPDTWPRTLKDFDDFAVRIEQPPQRVVSQYWSIDEFLYTLLPPEDVVGVSETAYLPGVSNVLNEVERFKPVVASDPERVMRTLPDLVVVASSARADYTALLRSTGVPVYRLATTFTTLHQIADTIRALGYLTGSEDEAHRAHSAFLSAVDHARRSRPPGMPPPRVLGLGGTFSYGSKTLFHDIVTTVGATNVGAEGGLEGYRPVNSEQILRWNPEWILLSAEQGKEQQVRQRVLDDPAIALTQAAQQGRILVFDSRVFMPMSPYTRHFLEALPRELYGN